MENITSVRPGRTAGIWYGILSAATFGLIPLFSIPVLNAGMDTMSVLFYRFAIACIGMLGILLFNRKSLALTAREVGLMALFGLLYDGSALCLYYGYQYMSSGAATTLIFMYPVWTAVIMAVFFRERLKPKTVAAIALALTGVFLLSTDGQESGRAFGPMVVAIVTMSGFFYAVYMVMVDRMNVREMGSLKLTFYTLLFAWIFLTLYLLVTGAEIKAVPDALSLTNLILLGILPTVISNFLLIRSIAAIGSTLAAILGAFEPVMAVVVGGAVFGEAFTLRTAAGMSAIILSVAALVVKKNGPKK